MNGYQNGIRIKDLLKKSGYRLTDVKDKSGYSVAFVSDVINGYRYNRVIRETIVDCTGKAELDLWPVVDTDLIPEQSCLSPKGGL